MVMVVHLRGELLDDLADCAHTHRLLDLPELRLVVPDLLALRLKRARAHRHLATPRRRLALSMDRLRAHRAPTLILHRLLLTLRQPAAALGELALTLGALGLDRIVHAP